MANNSIPLTTIINISILSANSGLGLPNINTAALFSHETPSWGDAYKIYTNATDVGTDFGTGANAYAIATAFFAQQPNVLTTNGYLAIIPLLPAETYQAAIVRTLNLVYYFGILVDQTLSGDDSTLLNLSNYVQTLDRMLFYASSNAADYAVSGIFDTIRAATDTHTRCLYYHDGTEIDTQAMAAAYASRLLSVNFSGSNTMSTMWLKPLATVVPDTTVDPTALNTCAQTGVDVYTNVAGQDSSVPSTLTSGANQWSDQVYGELAFKFGLQVAGFNYLRQTSTKVPQTESGLEGLKNSYRKVCDQYINNGFIAPGAWNASTVFGNPASLIRNIADIGYYVYSQPISQQSQAAREARQAPLIQIAIKSAGAIQKSNVLVNVNL